MNFAYEEGLRGPEDFFAALQDGRFGAFDIDLDQGGQDLPLLTRAKHLCGAIKKNAETDDEERRLA